MTVPSERDTEIEIAWKEWEGIPRDIPQADALTARWSFEAGFRAALEAQHTRDEEARATSDVSLEEIEAERNGFIIERRLATGEVPSPAETAAFGRGYRRGAHRAYVEQSDQGEKGDAG